MERNTCMTLTLVVIQVLLCGWIVNVDGAQCVQEGVCTCTFENGSKIDLSLLGNQHGSPLISDVPDPKEAFYSYSFNPCYPFTEGDRERSFCKNVSACQRTMNGIFYNIGDVNSAKLEYVGGRLVGNYSNTDSLRITRTSTVDFVCDPNADEPKLTVYGEVTMRFYRFSISSKYACASGQPTPSPAPKTGCHTNYGDFINRCEHAYDGQEQPIKVLIIQHWDGSCKFPADTNVAMVLHSESSTCVGVNNRCNPSHAFSVNGEVCKEVQ